MDPSSLPTGAGFPIPAEDGVAQGHGVGRLDCAARSLAGRSSRGSGRMRMFDPDPPVSVEEDLCFGHLSSAGTTTIPPKPTRSPFPLVSLRPRFSGFGNVKRAELRRCDLGPWTTFVSAFGKQTSRTVVASFASVSRTRRKKDRDGDHCEPRAGQRLRGEAAATRQERPGSRTATQPACASRRGRTGDQAGQGAWRRRCAWMERWWMPGHLADGPS